MLIGYKRGQGSIILRVKILNSSVATGAGLAGLTNASSGLIISTIADNEAAATAYTVAGSLVETITTLGTYAAPTATKCRFKEVDATNHKGVYEIHIADARFAVSNAKSLLVSISGATNAAETDVVIPLRDLDPYDAVRAGLSALPNAVAAAANGLPILGVNAQAISFTQGMTISNASGDALSLSSSGSNGNGLNASGNGTGAGIKGTGGATGNGIQAVGGATSGAGVKSAGTAGNSAALELAGQGSAAGLLTTGGATGEGMKAVGGATSGSGFKAAGTAGNAIGIEAAGQGSAAGLGATGGATGEGIKAVGGATSGSGFKGVGSAGNAIGIEAAGQGSAAGLKAAGGATGAGLNTVGGSTSGDGILSTTTSGHGMNLAPVGTSKHGILATGGNGGTSDGIKGAAGTGGVDLRAAITGDITGNVSKLKKYFQLALRKDAAIATDNATELTELNANGGSGAGGFDNVDDSNQGIRDAGATLDQLGVLESTTIATLASQTAFTLTAGSTDNGAYPPGSLVVVKDSVTAHQIAVGFLSGYTGSTKGVVLLADPGVFTMAVGDSVTILPPAAAGTFMAAMTESYAADGAAPTPAQMLFMIWSLMGEKNVSGATVTTKKLDGSTNAMTFTLSDATNPTSLTRAT